MAEQTFKSPNFYDREIDKSQVTKSGPLGTPAGVIGTATKGPAFVPVTVSDFSEFVEVFGELDSKKYGPYAAQYFLKHKNALTYLRVLGAGANRTTEDISLTDLTGQVKNAGMVVTGTLAAHDEKGRHNGCVQFITAIHDAVANEPYGYPILEQNDSFAPFTNVAKMIRGMVFMASGSRMMMVSKGNSLSSTNFATTTDTAAVSDDDGTFKLIISSSLGSAFSNDDNLPGIRVMTASLNPESTNYFAKLLNKDSEKFESEQHVLYADFPFDSAVATITTGGSGIIAIQSGSVNTSPDSGNTSMKFRDAFGHFDTRYSTPKTSWFISQPFGKTEHDLFYFETLDDGAFANDLYKVSISNIKASSDDSYKFGTFTILIRDWNDSDTDQRVLEMFPECSLDPTSERYVAKIIGDKKTYFNFDAETENERRLITDGKYSNNSRYVRIVMSENVEKRRIPQTSLPFGFRGMELLKTNDTLTDDSPDVARLAGYGSSIQPILPPVPFRFKVTKGNSKGSSSTFFGDPGSLEKVNGNLFWGIKFEKTTDVLNPNLESEKNVLLNSFSKFMGIRKLDMLVTGSGADTLNNNKFTLAKVALGNTSVSHLTASTSEHMKEAAYIRNGVLDNSDYSIRDSISTQKRITFGTLLAQTSSVDFNRFSPFMKFTNMFYGGFDGVNILDKNAKRMNDKATSFDLNGGAESSFVSPGLLYNTNGIGQDNNTVSSYMAAADIMLDSMTTLINILVVPGIKESFITDYIGKKAKDYKLSVYIMDLASYDDDNNRLYDDSTNKPDVEKTISNFASRAVDNSYMDTYFPDCTIEDEVTNKRVDVPASILALTAYAFNDKNKYPWFAPAGFNRGALDMVKNVKVRLSTADRDALYEARINPIATFPRQGFVIYGQRTLQLKQSNLRSVNVRRMILEVKRVVIAIASRIVFEQNTPEKRKEFVDSVNAYLSLVKSQQGVEFFKVVMDDSNNSEEDKLLHKVNGRVIVKPVLAIENIAIDFIITNSGVQFTS